MEEKRVEPGQRLSGALKAGTINTALELIREYRGKRLGQQGGSAQESALSPGVEVLVRNDSGAQQESGNILSIIGSPIDPSDLPLEFAGRPAFSASVPESEGDCIAVLRDGLAPEALGVAVLVGVAVVSLDVLDTAHLYATPTPADATKMTSANGGHRVLWFESSSNDTAGATGEQDAVVLLGPPVSLDGDVTGAAADNTVVGIQGAPVCADAPSLGKALAFALLSAPNGLSATLAAGGTLSTGTTYYYTITARNVAGETLPSAVGAVSATPAGADKSVSLSWLSSPRATGYKIYRGTNACASGLLLATLSATQRSYLDTGAITPSGAAPTIPTAGQWCPQRLILDGDVQGTISQFDSTSSVAASLNSVRGAQAVSISPTTPTVGQLMKVVAWAPQSGGPSTFACAGPEGPCGSLTVGTTYYYKMTVTTTYGGESAPSAEVSGAPVTGQQSLRLNWTALDAASAGGVSGFNIYRSTTSGSYGASSLLARVQGVEAATYLDTGTATIAGAPPSSNSIVQWSPQTASSGTVTSITAGTGLSGGTITTSGTISLTVPVTVPDGGTGATSFTAHGVMLGEGSSALSVTAVGSTNTVLHGNTGADPTFSAVVEGDFGFTDITTANASTSQHGLLRKLDNTATHYLDGTGAWSTPTGAVSSASNSDGTLTISPTTGSVVASLNLGNINNWTAQQYFGEQSISAASWNLSAAQSASLTLSGPTTLSNPSNQKGGATYVLRVVTAGNTLSYGTAFKWPGGVAPTLTGTSILTFYSDGTNMYGVGQSNFS